MKKIITIGYKSKALMHSEKYAAKHFKNFAPEWYKKLPPVKKDSNFDYLNIKKTVRSCPSFSQLFHEGIVVFAPVDILIKYKPNGDWSWETPLSFAKDNDNIPDISIHENFQMVEHLPVNSKIKQVFKINLPMRVFVPKGYRIRQTAMPYTFNDDWEVAYGVFDASKVHEVNIQLYYKSEKEEILIKQGTPLAVLIPYKYEEFELEVVDLNEDNEFTKKSYEKLLDIYGSFKGGYHKI